MIVVRIIGKKALCSLQAIQVLFALAKFFFDETGELASGSEVYNLENHKWNFRSSAFLKNQNKFCQWFQKPFRTMFFYDYKTGYQEHE